MMRYYCTKKHIYTPTYCLLAFLVVAVVTACTSVANTKHDAQFQAWLSQFATQARQEGISEKTLSSFIKEARYLPRVIELDQKQPGKTKTFAQYQDIVIPKARIKMAQKLYKDNYALLHKIGKEYGVQPRFIVALWGIESDFGRNMGLFNVPNALATLAFDGRRAEFFTTELVNVLKIIDEGDVSVTKMQGSWAGAMGQTQFMPSSFLSLAVDYDQDGKKDIWGTKADVFASIANYLSKAGWNPDLTWGREVRVPKGFDVRLLDKNINKPLNEWQALGVRNKDGSNLPKKKGLTASVIQVEERTNSRTFLIYHNYKIVLQWNRSRFFATVVGMLADQISG